MAKTSTQANAYYQLAKGVIPLAISAKDLRDWWSGESRRRHQYGLSDEQTDDLIQDCKMHIRQIGDDEKDDER